MPESKTLDRWQRGPWNRESFSQVAEILPSARVLRGGPPRPLLPDPIDLSRARARIDGASLPLAEAMEETYVDGVVVLRDGRLVYEAYPGEMDGSTPHLLMSVTKSLVGLLAGVLLHECRLHELDRVEQHVPELAASGWAGATVRDLLDMRGGIRFVEDYDGPSPEYAAYDRRIGWSARLPGDPPPDGVRPFLAEQERCRPHGGTFQYQSVTTDVLGWVLERAGGERWDALLGDRIWSRLGAERDLDVALDAGGVPLADGGASATPRDVARVGQLVLDRGRVGDRQVVPAAWIEDILHPPEEARAAFRESDAAEEHAMPTGAYRSQWWVLDPDAGIVLGSGIHGQSLLVDVPNRLVIAKASSWPTAWDDRLAASGVAVLRALRDATAR